MPFLLYADSSQALSPVFLSRTLASLRKCDSISLSPLLILYSPQGKFADKIREQVASVNFAPVVPLLSPPGEDPSTSLFHLTRVGLGLAGVKGVVLLPIAGGVSGRG